MRLIPGVFILISLFSPYILGFQRKLVQRLNPDCGQKCLGIPGALVHVAASGPNDTIHHVWDFFGKPTVFLASTPPNTSFTIDWDKFFEEKADSWKFSVDPDYVFAFVLDKLVEYDDFNNTAVYDPSTSGQKTIMPAESFSWSIIENTEVDKNEVTTVLNGTYGGANKTEPSGHVIVKLSAYSNKQHGNFTPHLYHTNNDTQIDIVLDKMPSRYNHSRYACEIAVFNTNEDPSLQQIRRRKLDDEHSPGLFHLTEVLTTDAEQYRGYIEWRSAAFTSPNRATVNSTDITDSKAVKISKPTESFRSSGVYAYFGKELDNTPANNIVISFGTVGDGYYKLTNFLSWTALVGIGIPAEENFSLLVLLVLGIGLGIPAILVIISMGCIVSRRINRTRDSLLAGH
ncbi:chromosome 1 open reading frame 85 [Nesidiocoris tenuis]|uniref:Chromosome 1 open reading frame 85 n=1 Tax=Nesidiocoris tenuis TaxID=355587 RepID=A0ABN7AQP7_9HEMI|nr:chromosome 1 open reading frame 85 [Nesidiocoris tenuis]